jgi:hypothetical protein
VSANVAFSLCAAVASLLVVVFAGVKGDWAVVVVYVLLVVGFLGRAALGRRRREAPDAQVDAPGPAQAGRDRRLRHARFRRR